MLDMGFGGDIEKFMNNPTMPDKAGPRSYDNAFCFLNFYFGPDIQRLLTLFGIFGDLSSLIATFSPVFRNNDNICRS